MTVLAVLAAFGAVIAITAETVRSKQASQIAAQDKRIAELEFQLAEQQLRLAMRGMHEEFGKRLIEGVRAYRDNLDVTR